MTHRYPTPRTTGPITPQPSQGAHVFISTLALLEQRATKRMKEEANEISLNVLVLRLLITSHSCNLLLNWSHGCLYCKGSIIDSEKRIEQGT